MTKSENEFLKDIERIYEITEEQANATAKFMDFESKEHREFLEEFLNENGVRVCDESIYAIATRIVNLKKDALVSFLKNEKVSENESLEIVFNAYAWAKKYYEKVFSDLLEKIEEEDLLTDFYRCVLKNVNNIGLSYNRFFVSWKKHIIHGVNKELKEEFGSDEKVFEFLRKEKLMDIGHFNEEADRSYSALVLENGKYVSKAYVDVFEEVREIVSKLNSFRDELMKYSDPIFGLENSYEMYILSLIEAFCENDCNKLVDKWSRVDRDWMLINSPIQIVHSLEYYDDHYRKAVQCEWDVRIINPKFAENERSVSIKKMYKQLFDEIGKGYEKVYEMCVSNVDRTQLYLGKPIMYFGSELEGLFSAQVVPNDMVASENHGKKIFANADLVLQSARNRPFMKLPTLVYENDFVKESRAFLMNETEKWHEQYDIETVGHEYGHILWLDKDNEAHMNVNGNFKNIEEFKATTGGLVSFFLDEKEKLKFGIVRDLVKRAVGLIAWMRVGEVLPYYCEGLIHLKGLFDTKVITWDGGDSKLKVDVSNESYERLKNWYLDTYRKLAITYLEKMNADEFLFDYATKQKNGENEDFLPVDEHIKEFVLYFYDLYEKHGNEVDTDDKKENYLIS